MVVSLSPIQGLSSWTAGCVELLLAPVHPSPSDCVCVKKCTTQEFSTGAVESRKTQANDPNALLVSVFA